MKILLVFLLAAVLLMSGCVCCCCGPWGNDNSGYGDDDYSDWGYDSDVSGINAGGQCASAENN